MAYHTAVPTKFGAWHRKNARKSIWKDDRFEILETSQGCYALLKGDILVAEIICGKEGFKKQHKNDPYKWIEKVRVKDLKKVEGIKIKAAQALEDAERILDIWK